MTKEIKVKNVTIGGSARASGKVAIQSMTNTKTSDAAATLAQIERLAAAGCDIVRCSVPDTASVAGLREICKKSRLPIVADIHFDHKLAIAAADAGAAKIRINPGNIGGAGKVQELLSSLKANRISVRIGVNGGSLEQIAGGSLAEKMVNSALAHARVLEDAGFYEIVLSVKASDVRTTVEAYRLLSQKTDYPLHIGVTEAGTYENGLVKSAVCLGSLLLSGIGDTIRVSLAGDPVREVHAAKKILRAVGFEKDFVEVIACPTCARTEIDVCAFAEKIEAATLNIKKPLKVAVMGCVVNGLGEAGDADLGVCGGLGSSILFARGKRLGTIKNTDALPALLKLIETELDKK